jgi:hypothetical protein
MPAQEEPVSARQSELWAAVDRLVERAPSLADLASHRIELFAARRWRAQGKAVPAEILEQERRAAIATLTAPVVLSRVREAYDGTIVPIKGMEVARLYPDTALRLFGDVDVIVDDAARAQAALLAAGFEEVGDPALFVDIHHLRPVQRPELPLAVEVHSRPKWVERLPAPPTSELLGAARADADGIGILPPAQHAVLLAVHSWAHEPLRRLRDVIDVAVMVEAAGHNEAAAVARSWGVEDLWRATTDVIEAVLHGGRRPWSLRLWAQNLEQARERTVLENHLQRWLSDFWILPSGCAALGLPATLRGELAPEGDEGWRSKLARSARALRNASRRRSDHDEQVAQGRRRP